MNDGEVEQVDSRKNADRPRYIVGIGASAGGLEALNALIGALPSDLGLCYVVVQHLSPTYRSMLVQLLGRETTIEVKEIEDGAEPRPDAVFITPPNRNLILQAGMFRLTEPDTPALPKPSINSFFHSLAEECGESAISIVLSGTGSDGASGTRAIKAGGGLTFAQSPDTAKYQGMPQAAIDTGYVDWILPPDGIARELTSIAKTQGNLHLPAALPDAPASVPSLLQKVFRHTRIDFAQYKQNTVWRRILRRMATNRVESLEQYIELTERNPDELAQLSKEILISVTAFFRDRESFERLGMILAERLLNREAGEEIRVWVPGCATGEEAYSIAIMLVELLGDACMNYKVQIFATDIDLHAMSIARRGIYPTASLSELPQEQIARHFNPTSDGYEVGKHLREMVVFARHDLAQDPPFVRLDLISCRNVLIYFQNALQERVLSTFHYALQPDALLFLGKSESALLREDLFEQAHREFKIFRRKPGAARMPIGLQPNAAVRTTEKRSRVPSPLELMIETACDAYVPPSVLIGESGEILHVFGETGKFLRIPAGRPDLQAHNLIRSELRTELQTLLHQSKQKRSQNAGRPRQLDADTTEQIRMVVRPVNRDGQALGHLVSFERVLERPRAGDENGDSLDEVSRSDIEDELIATREHLQTVIEELETSNEETQALNEELQASNEELQAANEELQSANEELQSTNEELTTVNEELQIKTAELLETNEDLENIQNSFGFSLLVVSEQMRLLRFNNAAMRQFGLELGSVGDHLRTILAPFRLESHADIVESVIDDGRSREGEITDRNRHYLMRVFPRRAGMHGIQGAVITLIDQTDLIELQRHLKESQMRAGAILDNSPELISIKDTLGKYQYANPAFLKAFGKSMDDIRRSDDSDLHDENAAATIRAADLAVLASGRTAHGQEAYQIAQGIRNFQVTRFALKSVDGSINGLCTKAFDITELKSSETALSLERDALAAALQGNPVLVVLFDPQGSITHTFGRVATDTVMLPDAGEALDDWLARSDLGTRESLRSTGCPAPGLHVVLNEARGFCCVAPVDA